VDEDDLDVAERIADRGKRDRFAEADERLDRVRAEHAATFRGDRFRYALARARLAAARGEADEAAAFAAGALWQLEEDAEGPELPRHPAVGRVRAGGRTRRELRRLAGGGDGERYDPAAEGFRSASSGAVQWTWALVERLRPNPAIAGRHDDRIAASRRNAAPLLRELRAAGYEAFDLAELGDRRLPDRGAAAILVAWLDRVGDPLSRSLIAMALTDPKARAVAAQPLLDLFAALPPEADEKDRVAAAAGTLARDPHFEQVAALVRDPAHGHYRSYLMTAVRYMKDPRAVDLCVEQLDDDALWHAALQALCGLRSRRARPVLERIAAEPSTGARTDAAQRQRDRVRMAARGLEQLDRAEAAGRARP